MRHVLRGNGLLRYVLKERMLGKSVRGKLRPRIKMIDDFIENGTYGGMKMGADGREK